MEITPQQLRDLDIPESFRGYNRDEVNDLLERAAETIDSLNRQNLVLKERVGSAVADFGRSRDNDDILQRTLIMAQRAADDAVAAANLEADAIRTNAADEAQAMLARSLNELQRLTDEERGRIQTEVVELAARRDALVADVAQLEAWDADYRERLVRQIESDLQAARQRPSVRAQAAPELHNVQTDDLLSSPTTMDTTQFEQRAVQAVAVAMAPNDSFATAQLPIIEDNDVNPRPLVGSAIASHANVEPVEALLQRPVAEDPVVQAPATAPALAPIPAPVAERAGSDRPSYLDEVLSAPVARVSPDIDLRSAEADRANLDDDAFFATLRDAVADDAPLGPGDQGGEFSEEPDPSFREMFRRRR